MKNLFFLILLIGTCFIVGCSNDDQEPLEEVAGIETRQQFNVNGSGWGCDLVISIFIPPCLSAATAPVWNQAILNTVNNYNNVSNLATSFTFATSAATADIVLDCYNNGNCDGGFVESNFVNTGNSSTIDLNTSLDLGNCGCDSGLDVCSATHIVMHEMAHALGYFHNNDSHPNAIHIEGTPDNDDPNSIINGGDILDWCDLTCEFSDYDIIALQTYYGCGVYDPEIVGLDNLCIGQEATYCVTEELNCAASFSWFGHPDIDGSTGQCVTLSYDANGTDFIYSDVQIGTCTYYSVVKKINIGPPNILESFTVEIDPCRHIIKIKGDSDITYTWGDFIFSNGAIPHVGISGGINSSLVSIRTPLIPGEEFCFNVQAKNDCGTSFLPCEVCYTIPSCRGDSKEGLVNVNSKPNNACSSNSQCPDGFTCQDGICCEEDVVQGDMCVTNDHCPIGFKCVFGDCCHIITGVCL